MSFAVDFPLLLAVTATLEISCLSLLRPMSFDVTMFEYLLLLYAAVDA